MGRTTSGGLRRCEGFNGGKTHYLEHPHKWACFPEKMRGGLTHHKVVTCDLQFWEFEWTKENLRVKSGCQGGNLKTASFRGKVGWYQTERSL